MHCDFDKSTNCSFCLRPQSISDFPERFCELDLAGARRRIAPVRSFVTPPTPYIVLHVSWSDAAAAAACSMVRAIVFAHIYTILATTVFGWFISLPYLLPVKEFLLCFISKQTSKTQKRVKRSKNSFYRAPHYVHSTVLRSQVVRQSVSLSVCDVGV